MAHVVIDIGRRTMKPIFYFYFFFNLFIRLFTPCKYDFRRKFWCQANVIYVLRLWFMTNDYDCWTIFSTSFTHTHTHTWFCHFKYFVNLLRKWISFWKTAIRDTHLLGHTEYQFTIVRFDCFIAQSMTTKWNQPFEVRARARWTNRWTFYHFSSHHNRIKYFFFT